MEDLGSRMGAAAILPPFKTIDGLTPKTAGFHNTRSASLPASTDPTSCDTPWAMAGLIVYLAMYRFTLKLSAAEESPLRDPRCSFILCAVCQVRMIPSPTRPIACESED